MADSIPFGNSLAITAVGMVCAVGHDAVASAASIRAGLTRFQPVGHFKVLEKETQELVPLTGSPVFAVTEGFGHVGRWIQMAAAAFRDLEKSLGIAPEKKAEYWRRRGLALVTPVMDDERFVFAFRSRPESMKDVFAKPLIRMANPGIPEKNVRMFTSGRTGVFEAVRHAYAPDAGEIDGMLVIAVDSYLDGMTLEWLAENGRLKSGANPTGLVPGEAAAAFMLEPANRPRSKRSSKVIARVRSVALGLEKAPHLSGQPNHGRALSNCLEKVLASAKGNGPARADLYADLNGENWRAYEYGAALSRIPESVLWVGKTEFVAASLGEIGASSAAAALVVAADAFSRNDPASRGAIVVASSIDGKVGAMMLEKTEDEIDG